jgi:hypothetical protein
MSRKNHKELVSEAEKAVSGVKDPNLRQIAFQKVLDDLLSAAGEAEAPKQTKSGSARVAKPSKLRGSARGGPTQYIQELIGDGFFKKPKTVSEVKAELGNRAHHIPIPVLSMTLMRLCRAKVLRRTKEKGAGAKNTFLYSTW